MDQYSSFCTLLSVYYTETMSNPINYFLWLYDSSLNNILNDLQWNLQIRDQVFFVFLREVVHF